MAVLHYYECPSGHVTEKMVDGACPPKRCGQEGCRRLAERTFKPRTFARCKPTVVYVNKEGNVMFPGEDRDVPEKLRREGYERMEVPAYAIRKFERQMNQREGDKWRRANEVEREILSMLNSQDASDLRNGFVFDAEREDGSIEKVTIPRLADMPAFYRDIAERAMKESEGGYAENYDPGFHVGAYS